MINHSSNGSGELAQSEVADQLYAELQVVSRRLRRIQVLVKGAVALEDEQTLWSRASEICGEALSTVEAAVLAVPEIACPTGVHRVMVVGELSLETPALRAWFADQDLSLSKYEFRLLEKLASSPTQVWSKAALLEALWGYASMSSTRTVDSHASRLRRKLYGAGAQQGQWVINVWGVGYALCRP